MKTTLIQGDCLEKLKELDANSVDSIVTDPPYGLGFMGKEWDELPPGKEVFEECLRVLKPGGHLLSFGGTRTYHRMAVAIEDAGFEIRDMIEWVYGSGFPKSLNISKQIDKQDTEDFRKQAGFVIKQARNKKGLTMDNLCDLLELNNEGHGGMVNHYENGRATPTLKLWEKMCEVLDINDLQDYEEIKKGRTEIIGEIENPISWFGKGIKEISTTEEAKQYEGWGTALKPAHEPICMARKPLSEKTVALNVLKHGTGGINIDESRVGTEDTRQKTGGAIEGSGWGTKGGAIAGSELGRFPANLIHDNSEEVRECFPEAKGASSQNNHSNGKIYRGQSLLESETKLEGHRDWYNDNGNASRFFKSIIYQAKASRAERNKGCEGLEEKQMGNNQSSLDGGKMLTGSGNERSNSAKNFHPTVKPLALMEYLITMVTPKDGTVLDPFMGSGTTGVTCKNLNRNFIGIEKDKTYYEIAKARIENTPDTLFTPTTS